jgi:hypothetical protein
MLATRYESEKAKDCRQEQAAERVQNESSHVSGFKSEDERNCIAWAYA